MNPSLYDLLDVDESATPEQIRAAWKHAIADLDPTDRRFRAYNDAAAVLLDPDRRSAYDAELAAAREDVADHPDADAGEAVPAEDVTDDAASSEDVAPPVGSGLSGRGGAKRGSGSEGRTDVRGRRDTASEASAIQATTPHHTPAGPAASPSPDRPGPSNTALIAAAVAAVLSLALMLWVMTLPGARAETSPQERDEEAASYAETATAVEEAAAEIARTALSYDYRTLDEDLARAQAVMTEDRAEEFGALFEEIRRENVRQKAVVAAAVYDTAVTRIADDEQQAEVLVFVDQDTKKAGEDPFTLRSAVTMSLVHEDGRWLLDDMCTTECD